MINHKVSIIAVDKENSTVKIQLLSKGACANCASKKACIMSESANKEWDIKTPDVDSYEVGQTANLSISEKAGLKAVLFAYVLPFICLVSLIFLVFYAGAGELIAGLSALAGTVGYFILLFFLSARIKKHISYTISPLPPIHP